MSNTAKVFIVITLILLIAAVFVVKNKNNILMSADSAAQSSPANVPSDGQITDAQQSDVKPAALPKLVDLGAGKCIPCKAMKPILEDLTVNYKTAFETVFIDVWENPDQAEKYAIDLIPTQIFFDSQGKELFRHQGFFSKEEILAKWNELGVKFQ